MNIHTDLSDLCLDRTLITREIFTPIAYYGLNQIIKTYVNLNPDYQLKVIYPHGIVWSKDHTWDAEMLANLPVALIYPEYRVDNYLKHSDMLVLRSASPYLYLLNMLGVNRNTERVGTIFFPAHSTHLLTVNIDFRKLAEKLLLLDDIYKPITVCMYWRDYNLGHHKPFEYYGFNIVSAGHIYDPSFLYRFHELCTKYKYSCSNEFGSHVFYSIKSGCNFFYLETEKPTRIGDNTALSRDISYPNPYQEEELKSIFNQPIEANYKRQLEIADKYLGTDFVQSPFKLRLILFFAEIWDKLGFLVYRKPFHKIKLIKPSYFRREKVGGISGLITKLGRKIFSLINNENSHN